MISDKFRLQLKIGWRKTQGDNTVRLLRSVHIASQFFVGESLPKMEKVTTLLLIFDKNVNFCFTNYFLFILQYSIK
jgi:hypothetical protein